MRKSDKATFVTFFQLFGANTLSSHVDSLLSREFYWSILFGHVFLRELLFGYTKPSVVTCSDGAWGPRENHDGGVEKRGSIYRSSWRWKIIPHRSYALIKLGLNVSVTLPFFLCFRSCRCCFSGRRGFRETQRQYSSCLMET